MVLPKFKNAPLIYEESEFKLYILFKELVASRYAMRSMVNRNINSREKNKTQINILEEARLRQKYRDRCKYRRFERTLRH